MKSITLLEKTLSAMKEKYGVYVIIKDMYSFMQFRPALVDLLRKFFLHENPYCMYIKGNNGAISECTRFEHTEMGRQMNFEPERFENGCLVTCGFGVKEFYYPIRCSGHTIGALVFGCLPCKSEEFDSICAAAAERHNFSRSKMIELYDGNILPCTMPDTEEFRREVALCGELLSMICDKLLVGISIDGFFKYNFILDDTNLYLNLSHNLREMRMLSKDALGENRTMTIVLNAISYIHNNYSDQITIEKIARYCYCSPSTLSHVFAKNYGMTIGKLIQTVRCDHAKELLRESSLSITQIALECGFSNRDYFTAIFKKITGYTPTEYRSNPNDERSV